MVAPSLRFGVNWVVWCAMIGPFEGPAPLSPRISNFRISQSPESCAARRHYPLH